MNDAQSVLHDQKSHNKKYKKENATINVTKTKVAHIKSSHSHMHTHNTANY